MRTDTWKLFKDCFKVGEEVVVVLDNGRFEWGKLNYDDNGITLGKGVGIVSTTYEWEDIRFMAHDGFPVKKVMCPPTDELLEKLDTTNIQKLIRGTLDFSLCKFCSELIPDKGSRSVSLCDNCKEVRKKMREEESRSYRSVGFGHPFLIEDVSIVLFNKGNNGPEYHMDYFLETLVLKSKDGAIGHLWDLPTIFHFE